MLLDSSGYAKLATITCTKNPQNTRVFLASANILALNLLFGIVLHVHRLSQDMMMVILLDHNRSSKGEPRDPHVPTVSEPTAALQPIPDSEETEQEMLDRVLDAPDPGKTASSSDPLLPRSEPRPRVVQVKREMESQAAVPGKDWSVWDLGRSMQLLRSRNSAVVRRTLRMLHIRWWHASAKRMYDILNSTGVSLSMSLI